MDLLDAQGLVTDTLTDVGATALVVFGAVIALGISVFVIRWGYRKVTHGLRGKV